MPSRRRRHDHEEEHENHERWLVSFADMMTLLMALFLMMYAMSVLDLQKFEAFRESFTTGESRGIQALPEDGNPTEGDPNTQVPGAVNVASIASAPEVRDRQAMEDLKAQLEAAIARAGLADQVSVALDDRGVAVFVTDGVLFDSGQATLLPAGQRLLDGLRPVFAGVGNKLVVEGHTDNVPIASAAFPSNWELSTSRSTSVLRSLLGGQAIDPARISAAGYADTRPRVPNDTREHHALNRRVEVVVVVPTPEPAPPQATTARAEPALDEAAHGETDDGH